MVNLALDIELIIFIAFIAAFLILLCYYLFIFSRLAFHKKDDTVSDQSGLPPVSIVIAVKNEEQNLQKNLPSILEQDYPEFEVIVINDLSTDNTAAVLEQFEERHKNLRTITIKLEGSHPVGKKYPLTLGIKGAKYETLLLTDADCQPKSKNWIRKMVNNYGEGTEIVLGYGAYEKKVGLLNKIIRFDTFLIALNYFSFALYGNPYMGVGRNLSYKRALFFRHKGFANHTHIASGDDDLFIGKVANKLNTAIEIHTDSHTVSKVKHNFYGWIKQKRRHLTTGKFYRSKTKFMLGLLALSNVIFILTFLGLVLFNYKMDLVLGAFGVKILVQVIIFKKSMDKLNEKDLLVFFPFFEVFLIFFYPYLYFSNAFIKQTKWK